MSPETVLMDLKIAVYAVQLMGPVMFCCVMTVSMLARVAAGGRTVKIHIMNNEGGECGGE
jgi:hypothetical protein